MSTHTYTPPTHKVEASEITEGMQVTTSRGSVLTIKNVVRASRWSYSGGTVQITRFDLTSPAGLEGSIELHDGQHVSSWSEPKQPEKLCGCDYHGGVPGAEYPDHEKFVS